MAKVKPKVKPKVTAYMKNKLEAERIARKKAKARKAAKIAAAKKAGLRGVASKLGIWGVGAYTLYELLSAADKYGPEKKITGERTKHAAPGQGDEKGLPVSTLFKPKTKVKKDKKDGSLGNIDMKDFTPKKESVATKEKKKKKYDPTKASRAGARMGQRKAGGMMKKMAVGGINRTKKWSTKADETPMGTFRKPVYRWEKISEKMKREIAVLKFSMKKPGVTAAQKKELKELIDAKKAGIKSTKTSFWATRRSSTIPTARWTQEDEKTRKETEGYQRAKKVLKVADKRIKRKAGGAVKKYSHGGFNTKGQGAAIRGTKFKGSF